MEIDFIYENETYLGTITRVRVDGGITTTGGPQFRQGGGSSTDCSTCFIAQLYRYLGTIGTVPLVSSLILPATGTGSISCEVHN